MSLYDKDNSAVTLTSYATYTAKTCPYTVPAHGCECLGNNDALKYEADGITLLAKNEKSAANHGEDYGKWCAAWEVRLAIRVQR